MAERERRNALSESSLEVLQAQTLPQTNSLLASSSLSGSSTEIQDGRSNGSNIGTPIQNHPVGTIQNGFQTK
jgi:hypothetical protein